MYTQCEQEEKNVHWNSITALNGFIANCNQSFPFAINWIGNTTYPAAFFQKHLITISGI
jgi:hypothetical protein